MRFRIQKILQEEGMTAAKFADEIGIQASSISHFISGRNKPSTDILVKILDRFRGLNAEWLLTGRGSMYKSNDVDLQNGSKIENFDKETDKSSSNDLFSGNYSETKAENIPQQQENENKETDSFEEKTILSENTRTEPVKYNNNPKIIEKIVVFYSDNTFEYYSPKSKEK